MSKEMTETTGTEVSTELSGGIASQFTRDDVLQGRLAIMQSGSNLVKSEDARAGAIVNLLDGEELAYKGTKDGKERKDLEFLICGIVKYWVVKNADTDDFIEKFPANNMNELPWNETVNGVNLERVFHYSYMVVLPEEIKDGIEMPYEFAFRSTGTKDTKKLNSIISRMGQKGISSHSKVFKASVVLKENDKHSWYGADLGISRDATPEEAACVEGYFNDFIKVQSAVMSAGDSFGTSEAASTVSDDINEDY